MAHQIEILESGKASMAWAGQVPWHGLGVEVGDDLTPNEMLEAASLNWKVRELATYAEMKVDGKTKRCPTGMKALVRETDGKVLTQVGKNWHPVQNEEAFEFFNEFVEMGDMKMHTAGSLAGGTIVWALAKVDQEFALFKDDRVESYLLFTNPHLYGRSIDVRFTPIRVVCNNTLTMALSQGNQKQQLTVNHWRKFDAEKVKEVMGIAKFKLDKYKEAAELMSKKVVKADVVEQYFGDLLGRNEAGELSRNAKLATVMINTQPGAEYGEGTLWAAYNTISFMTDHVMGRNNDTRLKSAWYGQNAQLKQNAINLAVKMAA